MSRVRSMTYAEMRLRLEKRGQLLLTEPDAATRKRLQKLVDTGEIRLARYDKSASGLFVYHYLPAAAPRMDWEAAT